jgi:hypothetical protein
MVDVWSVPDVAWYKRGSTASKQTNRQENRKRLVGRQGGKKDAAKI